jgi:hypothetical protein
VNRITSRSALLCLLAILAGTFLVYYPGLSGSFVLDDFNEIVNNPSIQLDRLTLNGLIEAGKSFISSPLGRPLPMITLALDHALWGLDPFGYKLTNVLVHIANATLLAWLASLLLRLDSNGNRSAVLSPLALFVVLLWAIHPLQVSTVLYAVQRMEMMAATFILLGLSFYVLGRYRQIEGKDHAWKILSLVVPCIALGVMCKETGMLLPAYALALEVTLLRFLAFGRRNALIIRWSWLIAIAAVTIVYFVYFLPNYSDEIAYGARSFTWQERILTQLRIVPMYLGQVLWPDLQNYHFYYDSIEVSKSILDPIATLWGGLLLLTLLAASVALRRRLPLFSLGVLWFFASHLLTSNVVALELAFEHRNYLAIFGILLAIAGLLRPSSAWLSKFLVRTGGAAVIVFVSFLTLLNTSTWGQPLELALALNQRNPDSERAQYMMGEMYRRMSDQSPDSPFFSMAKAAFSKASELPNSSPLPEHALIAMHAYADEPVDPSWWQRLIDKVENGPRGPMQIRAVRTLLDIHNSGRPIDPEPLMEAGIALLNKPGLNPSVNFEFALLALDALEDEQLARAILDAGAARSPDPDWPVYVKEALAARGHGDFAQRWWQSRN